MRGNQNRNARGAKRSYNSRDNRGGRGGGRGGGHRGGNNNRPPRNHNENRPMNMNNLKEVDVGITEFVGSTPPFNGIIKAKFSDFQVNEIDPQQQVAILTDITVPEPPPDEKTEELIKTVDGELSGLVPSEQWLELTKMIEEKDMDATVLVDVTEKSKDDRTRIHVMMKKQFGELINSSTVEENGRKCVKITMFKRNAKTDHRSKWTWPHEYTYFLVHKYNMDTMKACSELALNMKVKPSVLAYAGTKDKRANTTQWFCMRKGHPKSIAKAAERIPSLFVGNFTFKPETLKLGHLWGNRFKVALRRITVDPAVAEESLRSVQQRGFINYYGLQRFGNSAAVPTFLVGKALLQGQWSEAVELILKPRDGDPPYMQKMREFWWKSRDAAGALKMLHQSNNSIEAKLLFGLAKCDDRDLVNALANIPRNVRLLYMHAYQSLLWNKAASRRVQLGLTPIVGDLVFVDEAAAMGEGGDEDDGEMEDLAGGGGGVEDEENVNEEEEKKNDAVDFKALVRPLTQEDVDGEKFTMFDVVLPLPGHDITYPANEIGRFYEELLAQDDLTSEKLKQKNK